MAASVLLSYAILLSAALPAVTGQSNFCNLKVASQEGRDCVCTEANKLYDYREQDCVDETALYAYTDCGPNAGDNCDCDVGWKADPDTGLCTTAQPQCTDGLCEPDEACEDLPGRTYCRCEDYKYRFSDTQCDTIDETVNPQWHDCPQANLDGANGYTCRCFVPYFIDVDGDGRNCTIDSAAGYEDCSTEARVCAKDDEGEYSFPRSGYDDSGNDIDECTTLPKTYCWAHSTCVNLDGGQGYLCQCDAGYTDQYFDTPIKECVLKEEPYCSDCACDDTCEEVQCESGMVCSATSACSTDCVQSLQEVVLLAPVNVANYTGAVVVELPQFEYHANHIALSLETLIGRRDVQVLAEDNGNFTFVVTTQSGRTEGLEASEVQALISDSCLPLMESGLCQLPGGVVTANSSISVRAEPSCTASPCPSDEYTCEDLSNGRYRCNCVSDGNGTYISNYLEVCEENNVSSTSPTTATSSEVTNSAPVTSPTNPHSSTPDYDQMVKDLQNQLDDAEHSKTVTAATLGTLLFVAIIALVVLGFFYLRK